jgi:hypothetical protein
MSRLPPNGPADAGANRTVTAIDSPLARANPPIPDVTEKGAATVETLPVSTPPGALFLIRSVLSRVVFVPTAANPILLGANAILPGVGVGVGASGLGVGVGASGLGVGVGTGGVAVGVDV